MINYIRNKKGFTLVEIIVVLVIIAILVATTLPALTGYIDDARNKTALSEGRTALVAAQTISSEKLSSTFDNTKIQAFLEDDAGRVELNRLTGAGFTHAFTTGSVKVSEKGTVTAFKILVNNGKSVTYGTSGMSVN